ncbi:MAG: ferredoxin-NADP reductase, partial [Cyanobium sp.]
MRTSTAALRQSDARMFTLVVEGLQGPGERAAERRFMVPLSRMQATLRLINQQGGRLISVTQSDQAPTPSPD